MSYPVYVTDQEVHVAGQVVKAVVLLSSPKWVIEYDPLSTTDREYLDQLVTLNGGSVPLSSEAVAHNFVLPNGSSWYSTYIGATRYPATTLPVLEDNVAITTINDQLVFVDDVNNRYAAIPLDVNGNAVANITPRTNTLANLMALAGGNGEVAAATDIAALVVQFASGTMAIKPARFAMGTLTTTASNSADNPLNVGFKPSLLVAFVSLVGGTYGDAFGVMLTSLDEYDLSRTYGFQIYTNGAGFGSAGSGLMASMTIVEPVSTDSFAVGFNITAADVTYFTEYQASATPSTGLGLDVLWFALG